MRGLAVSCLNHPTVDIALCPGVAELNGHSGWSGAWVLPACQLASLPGIRRAKGPGRESGASEELGARHDGHEG